MIKTLCKYALIKFTVIFLMLFFYDVFHNFLLVYYVVFDFKKLWKKGICFIDVPTSKRINPPIFCCCFYLIYFLLRKIKKVNTTDVNLKYKLRKLVTSLNKAEIKN